MLTRNLIVVCTVIGQTLYQENPGDIEIPELSLSDDGTKLVVAGIMLKFYDLTSVVPPAGVKGGLKLPPPGGG